MTIAIAYTLAWSALTLSAIVLAIRHRAAFGLLSRAHIRSLLTPWKAASFALAAGFFILAAPYTGDPTWDRVDGAMMSVFTYLTSAWSVGTVVRTIRRRPISKAQIFTALVACLFSASWCYDVYLFWRDGRYPNTWSSNAPVSIALYVAAGMLWSLAHVPGRGMVFDFQTDEWLALPATGFKKIAVIALVLMVGVALVIRPFVVEILRLGR